MSHNPKYIGWFFCGVTSAVACKIAIDSGEVDKVIYKIKE